MAVNISVIKINNFVRCKIACNKYESSFRSTNRCNEIYNEGKDFYNDIHSVSYYLFILIIVIIIAIIARISNPELFPF